MVYLIGRLSYDRGLAVATLTLIEIACQYDLPQAGPLRPISTLLP